MAAKEAKAPEQQEAAATTTAAAAASVTVATSPIAGRPKSKISREVMRRLPKAELHKHLDGSVRVGTIIALAKEQGVDLPTFNEAELRKLVSVDEHCQSLTEYLRGFDITLKVLQRSYALTRAMFEVCEDSWNDGVRYLEIRFSPILHVQQGLSLGGVMEAVCEGLTLARYHFPIAVNIIVCAMRQLPANLTEDIAEIAWRYRHKGVCGFDLAGPELGFSSKLHRGAFDIVRSRCINCTLHSGEAAGWESIRDSIRECGANRIGHGVRLIDNPDLLEYVVSHRIAIESCPTSNVHTKAVARLEDHPIRKFFEAGAIVVPCTDNTTVSSCSLTGEYMLLQERFGFALEEIVRVLDYGFQAAFVTATEKRRLRADALHDTLRILDHEGYDTSAIFGMDVYYRSVGVNFSELTALPATPRTRVNRRASQPLVTHEVLLSLPKADLHCRLDGSVSIDLLWKEIQDSNFDLKTIAGHEVATKEELYELLTTAESKGLSAIAKDITKAMLQRPGQIERAVQDVLMNAVKENVLYMELMVRPLAHTAEGLSPVTVMDIVCTTVNVVTRTQPIKVGIVIYVSPSVDDPINFREMAQLCVDYKRRESSLMVGFGIYGDTSIPPDTFRFFMSTFNFLKEHNVNVAMVAGLEQAESILPAIHVGGASRISGAFQIHTFPRLMNYLAMYGIPVEISQTPKMRELTKDASFAGNAIRLFLDNDMPVTVCSFRQLFIAMSRTEVLESIVDDCKLDIAETLKLLSNGFRYNFLTSQENRALQDLFWTRSKKYLASKGFNEIFDVAFFP